MKETKAQKDRRKSLYLLSVLRHSKGFLNDKILKDAENKWNKENK